MEIYNHIYILIRLGLGKTEVIILRLGLGLIFDPSIENVGLDNELNVINKKLQDMESHP